MLLDSEMATSETIFCGDNAWKNSRSTVLEIAGLKAFVPQPGFLDPAK